MSNPTSVDVVDLLGDAAIGVFGDTADWGIFIGAEPPDAPNNCITIYDTPGQAADPKFKLDYPRFQVRVRSVNYVAGFAKAEACKAYLAALPSQTLSGTLYVGIWNVIDTFLLRRDEKNRFIFVNDWRVIREPTEGVYRQTL